VTAYESYEIPSDSLRRVSRSSFCGEDDTPAAATVQVIGSDLALVSDRNAEWDHLLPNQRATRVLRESARGKDGTNDLDASAEKIYGDTELVGWDPCTETFKDVPRCVKAIDFETPERQICDF
jgi:hypothetical protein